MHTRVVQVKLNFQYAHNSHEESEDKSIQDIEDALLSFDNFDWAGEAAKAIELQKCSPTLSLIISEHKEYIWVSAFEDNGTLKFVSECHFPGVVPSWFGLSKKEGIVGLSTQTLSTSKARKVIEHFIKKEHDSLRVMYA